MKDENEKKKTMSENKKKNVNESKMELSGKENPKKKWKLHKNEEKVRNKLFENKTKAAQ